MAGIVRYFYLETGLEAPGRRVKAYLEVEVEVLGAWSEGSLAGRSKGRCLECGVEAYLETGILVPSVESGGFPWGGRRGTGAASGSFPGGQSEGTMVRSEGFAGSAGGRGGGLRGGRE